MITASSLGTLIEWYDFYIFEALQPFYPQNFSLPITQQQLFLSTLATFAAGFVVRPFGALFLVVWEILSGEIYVPDDTPVDGRFHICYRLRTGYETIGFMAPVLVTFCWRLLQGIGFWWRIWRVATYVLSMLTKKEGLLDFLDTNLATAGLFISLIVILVTRTFNS